MTSLTIPDDEFNSLLELSKRKHLVVQKIDKGNNVVIINREVYIQRMTDLLADTSKFQLLPFKKSNQLRYLLNPKNISKMHYYHFLRSILLDRTLTNI